MVVVDLANVAYGRQARGEAATLANVNAVLNELGSTPMKVVAVADAALRHRIDLQEDYEKMIDGGQVAQAPAGTDADDFIWSLAERYRSKGRATYILTNDRFPIEKAKKAGMAHPDRITFMFVEGELIFQPPLSDLCEAEAGPSTGPADADQSEGSPSEPSTRGGELDASSFSDEMTEASRAVEEVEEASRRVVLTLEGQQSGPEDLPPELLNRLREFFSSRASLGATSLKVNFATVAHFLHSLYGGKFTTKFGYRRPKDLALALAAGGYVSISHHTTTLYIEPTAKLVGATPDQGSG